MHALIHYKVHNLSGQIYHLLWSFTRAARESADNVDCNPLSKEVRYPLSAGQTLHTEYSTQLICTTSLLYNSYCYGNYRMSKLWNAKLENAKRPKQPWNGQSVSMWRQGQRQKRTACFRPPVQSALQFPVTAVLGLTLFLQVQLHQYQNFYSAKMRWGLTNTRDWRFASCRGIQRRMTAEWLWMGVAED